MKRVFPVPFSKSFLEYFRKGSVGEAISLPLRRISIIDGRFVNRPYGAPLPKSEFAKGSEKGTIREAIVGVRLGESPGSTRLALRLRDSSLPLGMTNQSCHPERSNDIRRLK